MSDQKKLWARLTTADQEMTWNRLIFCPSCAQKRSTYIPGFALLLLLVGTTYLSTLQRETITFNSVVGGRTNCSKKHDVTKDDVSKTTQGFFLGNLLPSLSNKHPGYVISADLRHNDHFAKGNPKRTKTGDRSGKTSDRFALSLNQDLTYDSDKVKKSNKKRPDRDDQSYGSSTYSPEQQRAFSSPDPLIAKLFEDNVPTNKVQKIYFKRFDKWTKAKNISLNYFMPQISRLSFTEKTAFWKTSLPYRPKDVDLMALKPFPFLESYKNPCWIEYSRANYSGSFYTSRNDVSHELAVMAELLNKRRRIWDFHRVRCLPYFLIIGQPKCGSTDLYRKIIAHPDVCNIPPALKEPHWWARTRLGRQSARGHVVSLRNYVDLFDHAAYRIETETETDEKSGVVHNKITGEGSMSTFWDNDHWWAMVGNENTTEPRVLNPDYVHHVLPNAKLILILRNPTTRMYSDFLYFRKDRKLPVDFHQAVVNAVRVYKACIRVHSVRGCVYNATTNQRAKIRLRVGMYAVFLAEWLRVFPRQQLFIVRTEDYAEGPQGILRDIYDFLGLRNLTADEEESILSMQKANTRRKQDVQIGDMLPETRVLLDAFYKPYNEQLARMLGDNSFLWNDGWS